MFRNEGLSGFLLGLNNLTVVGIHQLAAFNFLKMQALNPFSRNGS
jgi:hypothetical protein